MLSVLLSLIYGFWLSLWYLVAIKLSVLLSFIYGFWLPRWYLVAIILCVLLSLIYGFWLHLRCLVAIVLSVLLSLTYGFWLHLWYLQTYLVCLFAVFHFVIILPVFLPYTEGFVWYDGCWIYNYLCYQCLSPLKLLVRISLRRDVQHYVIKFVNDLQQVGDFHQVFRFPPPITLTTTM